MAATTSANKRPLVCLCSHLCSRSFMFNRYCLLFFTYACFQLDFYSRWFSCPSTLTRRVSLVKQNRRTLPRLLSLSQVFNRVCGAQSLTFYVMLCQPLFVSLSFFSFGDCIVSPSSLYGSASDYPLVSSNFSNYSFHANQNKFFVRKHIKKVTERDMSLAHIDSSQRGPRKWLYNVMDVNKLIVKIIRLK